MLINTHKYIYLLAFLILLTPSLDVLIFFLGGKSADKSIFSIWEVAICKREEGNEGRKLFFLV